MTRNGVIFLFCLLIALALLLVNKLSRNYTSAIPAKVSYRNFPENKVAVAPLPTELKLLVETTGMKLLWLKVSRPVKVTIDLSRLTQADFLVAEDLRPSIVSQLPADYKLVSIQPDTLFFSLDNSQTKRVRIISDILISFRKQYDFAEPLVIQPESVKITGPANSLDTIHAWKTEKLFLNDLNRSVEGELPLQRPSIEAIVLEPDRVRYVIVVEEYTEKTLELPIRPINVPKGTEVTIFPRNVRVVFKVGLNNYEKAIPELFTAEVDLAGIEWTKTKYLLVNISRYPPFIKNLDYSPKSVEFIVHK
ncbi:MAG: hypothetical protein KatS3mg031_0628 [Chitinophagales bacterium]|nr:MAG: hypothetical protein KatS3mg031_0628 [Chitinophagales bacterium]